MIEVSKMTKSDLNEISAVLQTEFDDFWNQNIFEKELENENSEYIVARMNNEIVGFGGIWITPVDIHITNIVTKKTKRNMGIGSAILQELINLTKSKNYNELTLEVNEKNEVAQKLYMKYGFEVLGRRKRYYDNINDAIIMTLKIL